MIFRNPTDYIILIVTIWFAFLPIIAFGFASDRVEININNDYLEEYNQCKLDLENTQPTCPDCVCKSEEDFMKYFYGFIFGGITMGLFIQIIERRKESKNKKHKAGVRKK